MDTVIPLEVLMPSTKYMGSNYPTHFLKSRGSVFMNNFLEQATLFAQRNDLNAKPMLNMHISCSCSDTIYRISIKKNTKKREPDLKVYHFSISQHFPNVKV